MTGYFEVWSVLGCICVERYVFPCMGLIKALVRYILVKRSKTTQIISAGIPFVISNMAKIVRCYLRVKCATDLFWLVRVYCTLLTMCMLLTDKYGDDYSKSNNPNDVSAHTIYHLQHL